MNATRPVLALAALLTACSVEVGVGTPAPTPPTTSLDPVDLDQDGYSVSDGDCDDLDPLRGPGFDETCDSVDNDCDGVRDGGTTTGEGAVCQRSEIFAQTLKVDVLFVIDPDETMEPARDNLADAIGVMLPYLVGDARDTHIGVLTMDMMSTDHQGRLVEAWGDRWVDGLDHTADQAHLWLATALTDHAVAPGNAVGGRAVVREALTTHLDGHNAGFLREDASMAVFFVTNRDDPVETPDADDLWNTLATLHGGSLARTSTYAVVQDDDYACDGVLSPDTYGEAYLELSGPSSPTRGNSMSVCSPSDTWEGFLEAEAQDLTWEGIVDSFTLSEPADVGSLVVTYDIGGVIEASEGVSLSTDGRTVVVDDPPPPGAVVRISYHKIPD